MGRRKRPEKTTWRDRIGMGIVLTAALLLFVGYPFWRAGRPALLRDGVQVEGTVLEVRSLLSRFGPPKALVIVALEDGGGRARIRPLSQTVPRAGQAVTLVERLNRKGKVVAYRMLGYP